MRKSILLALFLGAGTLLFAQQGTTFSAESAHYRVYSQTDQAQADDVSRLMEACFTLYNGVFHFDLSLLPGKLQVKVFKDVDSFNAYLDQLVGQKRTDFVFVAYSDPQRSQLLAFTKEPQSFLSSMIHQGLIQFLKAFIANPPVWLREGVATYLEASTYDAKSSTLAFTPNDVWLDPLKSIMKGESAGKLIPVTGLLTLSRDAAQTALDVFYPEAWGLVTYLMDSPQKADNRMMWDAISSLDPKATLEENSARIQTRAFSWQADQAIGKGFQSYVLSLKTAQDLIRDGVDSYSKGDLDGSEKAFQASLQKQGDSYVAFYYLGLIAYSRKDYTQADQMYVKAASLGMSSGLVDYAQGVNAFAAGKLSDAANFLKLSKDAEPATFGDKVDALLKRIGTAKN